MAFPVLDTKATMAEKRQEDTVKHVVSILKTALEQLQESNQNSGLQPKAISVSSNQSSEPNQQQQNSQYFSDAARRDFRY